MSLVRLHVLLIGLVLAACGSTPKPQLKVLGMEQTDQVNRARDGRQLTLFVEVVNHAKRPMRLQRLRYSFGPSGEASARGEVMLSRTVEAGSAVVVEVPIDVNAGSLAAGDLELRGQLTAEQDQVVRTYAVKAEVTDETATSAGIVIHSPSE